MGLFDFVKNAGAKLFGKGKKEEEAIEELLKKDLGNKLTNLKVEFKDGVVKLYGEADTHDTKEKAVLLAGNVEGVEKVDDANLSAPEPKYITEFYTVVKGDWLSKIAKKFYGDAKKWNVIFDANKEVIKDPDLIYPGQQLRIPKL